MIETPVERRVTLLFLVAWRGEMTTWERGTYRACIGLTPRQHSNSIAS